MQILRINNLLLAFSQVSDGNMSVKYTEDALSNRRKFLENCKVEGDSYAIMNLVGNGQIKIVDDPTENQIDAEGLITKCDNFPLLLLTADCIPTVIFDGKNKILGLLHLGRVNTDDNLLAKMIDKMLAVGADIDHLKLVLGPGIRKESYCFKDLPELQSGWSQFSHKEDGRTSLDLFGFNRAIATGLGVKKENIIDMEIDSYRDQKYFSHRRSVGEGSDEGRFLTLAINRSID